MEKKASLILFISCLLLLLTISGCSNNFSGKKALKGFNNSIFNETSSNRTAMENLLEKACIGKSIADTCSVMTTKGKATSTCDNVNGRVLCRMKLVPTR